VQARSNIVFKVREGLETLYKEGFRKGLRGFGPT
jgi:hypothetical protein